MDATQFIDGTDAAQLMRDRYPAGMPFQDALAITTAIAEVLDYAHDRRLVHRDVKPANILLSQPDHDGSGGSCWPTSALPEPWMIPQD